MRDAVEKLARVRALRDEETQAWDDVGDAPFGFMRFLEICDIAEKALTPKKELCEGCDFEHPCPYVKAQR